MFSKNEIFRTAGGALYYVIFMVFVLTTITSLYLMQRGAGVVQVRREVDYFASLDDLNSALILYLSDPEQYQQTNVQSLELFGDSSRRVQIIRKSYGLLDLVRSETFYRGKLLSKTILAGKNPFKGDSIALYVPDRGQNLYASGSTMIRGNVLIPAKGIQRASIEGQPLREVDPVSGIVGISGDSLPRLAPRITEKLYQMNNLDSLCMGSKSISELYASFIEHPLSEDILWYGSADDFQISGFEACGAVGFCSKGTILIRKDTNLEGTLVSARNIVIEDGFEGVVQLFAQDSLIIGKTCKLKFPSAACLSSEMLNKPEMIIGEYATIEGTVLVAQSQPAAKEPSLLVKEGAIIRGQVYHQGKINLLGAIHGSLYCEGFYLKTKRAFYENHLLDNEIDFLKLPGLFVSIDLIQACYDQLIDVVDQDL